MAKTSGGVRNSTWENDIYTVNGVRKEYYELNPTRKHAIAYLSRQVAKEMNAKLKGKVVEKDAGGERIKITFNGEGNKHVAQDLMLTLSGKYMSRKSMVRIDKILEKSTYVPTTHALKKERRDTKEKFFKYKDKDGRGIYFKVTYDPKKNEGGRYFLYSVTDKP